MKEYITVNVPATTKEVQTSVVCDICGQKSIYTWSWKTDNYDATDIEIMHRTGNNYPEGGSGTKFECDICPECFQNKLVPFLQSIAKHPIDYVEWDT